MPGLSSILNIGEWALFAFQSGIEVTGNNIANVNTEGYSRQEVRLEEGYSIDYVPGQLGTGVRPKEVIRHFNEFIEEEYNTKATDRERFLSLFEGLEGVESLFNEADAGKVNDALAQFWEDWQALSMRPEDINTRSVLLADSQDLVNAVNLTREDLERIQDQLNDRIEEEVDEVNDLIEQITELNGQINIHEVEGQNNPNALYDKRATLVRELAEKIDINYIDNGGGNITILTKAGHTLVDGQDTDHLFELKFEGATTYQDLSSSSVFDGEIYYSGSSDYEYTVEVVTAGDVGGSPPAEFKISIDGGQTYLEDANGNSTFEAQEYGNRIATPDGYLQVWFGSSTSSTASPTNPALSVGDTFTIIPKQGLYWYENTSSEMNITPLVQANGEDDPSRITGGVLTGLFSLRDTFIGRYKEKLDTFAEGLAWEVNRLHSQGAGLDPLDDIVGTYSVSSTSTALGDSRSGNPFYDKLTAGNITVHVYDASTGALSSSQVLSVAGGNFDPATHDLSDVQTAFDNLTNVSASITNNRLRITADSGYEIAFGGDTTGLLAALGINTYFDGDDASSLSMNSTIANNVSLISAGHVNGAGEMNSGDNLTALDIAELQYTNVTMRTSYEGTTTQTLSEYYNSLSSNVGSDTAMAEFNYKYQKTLSDDLHDRQEQVSGVNLDEEMSDLIKFQHAYGAAAKLITTADQMLQTLLTLKQ